MQSPGCIICKILRKSKICASCTGWLQVLRPIVSLGTQAYGRSALRGVFLRDPSPYLRALCIDFFFIVNDADELIENHKTNNLPILKSSKSKDDLIHISMKIFKLFIEIKNNFQDLKENLLSSKLSVITLCKFIQLLPMQFNLLLSFRLNCFNFTKHTFTKMKNTY